MAVLRELTRGRVDIRTYGVVTLNEECGFIQWVPNTIPLRPVLMKGYDARRIKSWVRSRLSRLPPFTLIALCTPEFRHE